MSEPKHYPGPWVDSPKAPDAIVAPDVESRYKGEAEHYGGALVAESIASCNKPLIKAAPAMLAKLEEVEKAIADWPTVHEGGDYLHGWILNSIRDVIAQAKGEPNATS